MTLYAGNSLTGAIYKGDQLICSSSKDIGVPREIINRVYTLPQSGTIFNLPDINDIGDYALYQPFHYATGNITVNMPDLTTVSGYMGMYSLFYIHGDSTSVLSLNVPNLVTVSGQGALQRGFYSYSGAINLNIPNLTIVSGQAAFADCFYNSSLSNISLNKLTTIGVASFSRTFYSCLNLTQVSLDNVSSIDQEGFKQTFASSTNLTGAINLSKLTTIGNQGLYETFARTSITSLDLSKLQDIPYQGLYSVCNTCSNLTSINLSNLKTISGYQALASAFVRTALTTLSFPALTSANLVETSYPFTNMLNKVTGCIVHFPSNLQSVIGSWSDVTRGFGGTNTTVLFDLPATS